MQALNDRHKELMEKSLRFKEELLDTYVKKIKESPDEDQLKTFVNLADSLENNITKSAKLDLMKEKNEIDRANGNGLVEVFRKIQERKIAEHIASQNQKEEEEEVEYKPVGMELEKGELLAGSDSVDYETFISNGHLKN